MNEKTYPPGQYVAGENLELGDYLLKTETDCFGMVEIFEDYDHFVADDDFLFNTFDAEYSLALRKKGVVIVIRDAVFTRIQTESNG